MRLGPLVVTALIVGALLSLMGAGTRGFRFLPTFLLVSGFVLGIGLMVNRAAESVKARRQGRFD